MRRPWPLLLALSSVWFATGAEVTYLPAEGGRVPAGRVKAVEARAALAEAHLGSSRASAWTLSWPGAEVTVEFDNRYFVDGVDNPRATVSCGGKRATVTSGFDFSGGFNSVAVEWNADGTAVVYAGDRELRRLFSLDSLAAVTDTLFVSGSSEVLDLIVETDPDDFGRLMTAYSAAELEAAPRWHYLDRENDPATALPGGSYVLAAVETERGYDLVYLAGALTNASHWHPGMLKGRMTATGFQGYYRLEWFDATGRRLPDECYAQTEGGKLLTLHFPALQASLRFALRQ